MKYLILICLSLWNLSIQSVPGKVDLIIHVSNIENDNGQVILDVFSNKDGFPGETDKALKRVKSKIIDGKATLSLNDLSVGEYAFAVIHDANMNDMVDVNFFGLPKEGLCASNNAKGSFGPPSYEDSKFSLTAEGRTMQVQMKYL